VEADCALATSRAPTATAASAQVASAAVNDEVLSGMFSIQSSAGHALRVRAEKPTRSAGRKR
jgi:hypothetical protein